MECSLHIVTDFCVGLQILGTNENECFKVQSALIPSFNSEIVLCILNIASALKQQCRKDFAVLGQFCAKSLL